MLRSGLIFIILTRDDTSKFSANACSMPRLQASTTPRIYIGGDERCCTFQRGHEQRSVRTT